MSLRRPRYHTTGISNIDSRVSEERKQQRAQRLPLHETRIKYYDAQLGRTLDLSPAVDLARNSATQSQTGFYKSVGKPVRIHPDLTKAQKSPLKGHEFYVGGDNEPYMYNAHKDLRSSGVSLTSSPTPQKKEISKYYKTKEIEHKKAVQETQLVHMGQQSTLEGQVDLSKIVDIRRTIRRRYANRHNLRQIFNQWDQASLGVIRVEDVHSMINRLGIPMNKNEAKVLVASANPTGSGVLNLEEFMQMVFDDNEKMNVDLATMKTEEEGKETSGKGTGDTETVLADTHILAVNEKMRKLQEQLKLNVQEKLTDVVGQMVRTDKNRSGVVSFEAFCDPLNNMGLSHTISNNKLWSLLFSEFGGKPEGINYRDFSTKMQEFVPEEDGLNRFRQAEVVPQNPLLTARESASFPVFDSHRRSLPTILDPQKVPVNRLESILQRSRRVRLYLKERFGSKTAFREYLASNSHHGAISQASLKALVQSNSHLAQIDLDNFLSSYTYNTQGETATEDVVFNVFSDDIAADKALSRRARVIPPARKSTSPDKTETPDPEQVKRILQHIDQKIFTQGKHSLFKAFKSFDSDNDGYLTLSDLTKGLVSLNIPHTESGAKGLMRIIDKSGKGYSDFNEFAEAMMKNTGRENGADLKAGEGKYWTNVQPSKEFLDVQLARTGSVNAAYERLRTNFKPPETGFSCPGATRFGSKPAHKDTFCSFAPTPEAGMYMDDKTRFLRKSQEPINLGNEDKAGKQMLQEAKSKRTRSTLTTFFQTVTEKDDSLETRDMSKIGFKAASKAEYERVRSI